MGAGTSSVALAKVRNLPHNALQVFYIPITYNHFLSPRKLTGLRAGKRQRCSRPLEATSIPRTQASPEEPTPLLLILSLPLGPPRAERSGSRVRRRRGSGRLSGRHLAGLEAEREERRSRASPPLPSLSLAPPSVLLPTSGSLGRSLSGGTGSPGGRGGVSGP